MREFLIPVLLQLAGVIIIIAEIFLPSGGLLSLMAAGLFGYSGSRSVRIFVVYSLS
jgi:membrane-bound serine protease (ClpP class)